MKMPVKPGIYEDVSFSEYTRMNAVGRSELMSWAINSDDNKINPEIANFGTAFHTAIIEPQHWKRDIAIAPAMDRKTKEGKQQWAAFVEKAKESGKTPITASQRDLIGGMGSAIKAHEQIGKLRSAQSKREVVIVWEYAGVLLKARLDQVTSKAIIDWKSTSAPDAEVFAESCVRYGYHVQHAMYQDGWEALTGQVLPFVLIGSSKRPPHHCFPHRIEQVHVDHGRTLYQTLIGVYARTEKK